MRSFPLVDFAEGSLCWNSFSAKAGGLFISAFRPLYCCLCGVSRSARGETLVLQSFLGMHTALHMHVILYIPSNLSELLRVSWEHLLFQFFLVSFLLLLSVSLPGMLLPSQAAAMLNSCEFFLTVASGRKIPHWACSERGQVKKDKPCEWEFRNMPDRSSENDSSLGMGIFLRVSRLVQLRISSGCESAGFQTAMIVRLFFCSLSWKWK